MLQTLKEVLKVTQFDGFLQSNRFAFLLSESGHCVWPMHGVATQQHAPHECIILSHQHYI